MAPPVATSGLPRWVEAPVALAALVVVAPLLAVLGVLIRATSQGPAFFRQPRVGREGRHFMLFKLRTMRVRQSGPQVTSGDDERTTYVGRLLRRSKLDELPELWNVVKGDMSLVGPRPEVPRYVNLTDSRWSLVLQSRPGLTDPVTLALRNEESLLARVTGDREAFYLHTLQPYKLDGYLAYAKRRTARSDLAVLARTVVVIAFPSKAPVSRAESPRDEKIPAQLSQTDGRIFPRRSSRN
jgi:lipopolysaccharide/colanic/teichoic acid biosynthesis glycosyltransferase